MSLRLSGGRRLQSPAGNTARPTPSRVRLAVMNMLQAELPGCSWLDLCCGSGVMACEAIMRGASRVVAVEQDRRIALTARHNLDLVANSRTPPPQLTVVQQEVVRWLGQGRHAASLHGRTVDSAGFDLIYADPPYTAGLYAPLLESLAAGHWLNSDARVMLECASAAIPALPAGWRLIRERRYGSTTVLLVDKADNSAS